MSTYSQSVEILRIRDTQLAERDSRFVTLEHILDWLTSIAFDLRQLDLITQDEYSHDLIVPDGHRWISFAMT